ncbi:hypothetical protein SGLAU_00360 [Streptomyces glaucescens]|uniref:Uncharacterized protein n=1 Tax=Streptomyces glaucescens TaxID=1907 RepID=A0A089YR10_STRGA|nr:hypothetical protein SGLAU_00360 [Streptomyces glaucescens]
MGNVQGMLAAAAAHANAEECIRVPTQWGGEDVVADE